jgi:exosome complex exonuclease RRP6
MDMEDAIKRLGQATVGAVRAANELPSGRDYALHRSTFTEFQTRVAGPKGSGKAQKRVLALLDRIFTQIHGEPSNYARQKGVEADDVFETVVDFADGRLEAVDVLMDEMAGRAPIIKAGIVGGSMYGGGTGKGGKFSALIRGKPEDLGLAKPQLRFKDPVDNSNDTPFAPKAWPKVHAVSESKSSAVSGRHPYAAEMEAVKYTEHQLTPPGDIQEPRPMQETPFTFIDSLEGLEAMHSVLLGCPEIAVDLEHHSVRSFQGFVCLMQISTREQDFIVDTIALRANMHVLLPAFTDPSITKVFLNCALIAP